MHTTAAGAAVTAKDAVTTVATPVIQLAGSLPLAKTLFSGDFEQRMAVKWAEHQREAMLLTRSAEQRYQWLTDNEPDLLQRLPQFHIASYIGVDAVSLSRLKRKLRRDA